MSTEERERASSSPNSRGGSEHWLRSKDNHAGAGSEDNLGGATKSVECDMGGGGRGRCFGVCDLLRLRGGLALAPPPLLCFAVIGSALTPMHKHSHFVLLHSPLCSLHREDHLHGAILNRAGCFPFWTCHIPYHDSYRNPCR